MNNLTDAFQTIRRSWRKYVLTVIGIAIGVASVVLVDGLGHYGTESVLSELNSLGRGGILLSIEDSEGTSVLDATYVDWFVAQEGISYAMPILTQYSHGTVGEVGENLLLFSANESVLPIMSLTLEYGTAFSASNMAEAADYCMIDAKTAEFFFGKADAIGGTLNVVINKTDVSLKIIGILEAGSGFIQSTLDNYVPPILYLPYTTLQKYSNATTFQQLAIRMQERQDAQDILTNLINLLCLLQPKVNYNIRNLAQQVNHLNNLLHTVQGLLTAVAAISLFVACIGIMTSMTANVRERRQEIGIRKAIGATTSQIIRSFLLESVILSWLGSLFGILIGCMALQGFSFSLHQTVSMNASTGLILSAVSVIVGGLFGGIPAFRAGAVMPMEAIRQTADAP